VKAPYLKETLKLWRRAQKKLKRDADHTEIYRYLESLNKPKRSR
jgi:hypothetical protein